jgi:hypothetical protein
MSAVLPAASGTSSFTGRAGQFCASALVTPSTATTKPSSAWTSGCELMLRRQPSIVWCGRIGILATKVRILASV